MSETIKAREKGPITHTLTNITYKNPVGPKTSMSETIKAREKGPITHTLTNITYKNPVGPKTSMSETIKARENGPITHTLTSNFQSLCPKSTFFLKAIDKNAFKADTSEKDDSHIQALIKMVAYTLHSPAGRTWSCAIKICIWSNIRIPQ